MGWNDRMDFPEYYGAQYARDRSFGYDDTTANILAEQRAEAAAEGETDCPHESSRPAGDGLQECIDCGETFVRTLPARVA